MVSTMSDARSGDGAVLAGRRIETGVRREGSGAFLYALNSPFAHEISVVVWSCLSYAL